MANAIVGTLILLAMAAVIGVPVGVMGGIYLAEYGSERANDGCASPPTCSTASRPSSGAWSIYVMLVSPFKTFSAYAGGVALGLMMIPLVMRTTEEVLLLFRRATARRRWRSGIARWKIIVVIVVKTALKGIVTGILIALARVAGETAPLLFTALGNNFWNHNLQRADRGPSAADLRLRHLAVRRLAPPGVGRARWCSCS